MRKSDVFIYLLAVLFGLSAGLLEITVGDLLATALCVLISTLVLGFVRPRRAWRWTVIVGAFVPLMRLAALVTGIAGSYAGAMARLGVDQLFRTP